MLYENVNVHTDPFRKFSSELTREKSASRHSCITSDEQWRHYTDR